MDTNLATIAKAFASPVWAVAAGQK
jgi:hypothetical protein